MKAESLDLAEYFRSLFLESMFGFADDMGETTANRRGLSTQKRASQAQRRLSLFPIRLLREFTASIRLKFVPILRTSVLKPMFNLSI